jgi:two-component system, sensor histidine kinase and response regulator
MPVKSGFEVLEEVKSIHKLSTIPFIFLSAKNKTYDARLGMNKGADDYLTKPFTSLDILKSIETRLSKFRTVNTFVNNKIDKSVHKKIDELKLQLASTIPHEFKTPLNGIIVSGQLLAENASDVSEESKELIDIILLSAKRLNDLVDNFLYYNKLELKYLSSENLPADNFCFGAHEIIKNNTVHLAKMRKRENDLEIKLEKVNLKIGLGELSKLISELMSNALKFSKTGSKISLDGQCRNGDYHLLVADNGKGFPLSKLSGLEAFTQFDREQYEQQGIGLGLMIVKRICEINNCHFFVDSDGESYSRIHINIPIHKSSE